MTNQVTHPIESLLAVGGLTGREIVTEADLRALWALLISDDEDEADYFISAVVQASDTGNTDKPILEARLGGWEISLADSAAKTALVSAFLSVALAATGQGIGQLAPQVVVAVIPLLFDLRRVRLSAHDGYLHTELIRLAGTDPIADEHALYEQLPADVRDALMYGDFLDFLERLRRAGLLSTTKGRITLRPHEQARFKLTIV